MIVASRARRAMLKAYRQAMRRPATFDPTAVSWWHLSVNNDGYIMNMDSVHEMLERYDLLDKGVVRFIATPQGIDAYCLTGNVVNDEPELQRIHRPWKET